MWPSSARQINYGLPPEMNMVGVGLRDLFVVAPAHHPHPHHPNQDSSTISFDPLYSFANNSNAATATTQGGVGVGVGVGLNVNLIPLLSATPCLPAQQPATAVVGVTDEDVNRTAVANLLKCSTTGGGFDGGCGGGEGGIGGASGGGLSTSVCQDCGNQAKKDCNHGRCRTCCKSRGYNCATHVKSTWVPAARRREKQATSSSGSKKPRLLAYQTGTGSEHTSTSNTTTPRSFDNSSCQQDEGFKLSLPEQVQAAAKFKFMKITSIEDDGDDEFAYEAVVKIGGHVFRGVLYDRGSVQPRDGFPNIAELHLGGNIGGVGASR